MNIVLTGVIYHHSVTNKELCLIRSKLHGQTQNNLKVLQYGFMSISHRYSHVLLCWSGNLYRKA